MADLHSLGKYGENLATSYLRENGYRVIKRNWRTGKKEIDIIAEDDHHVIFIEVKTRTADFQLHPRDAVSVPKQRNLIFAAQTWLERSETDKEARFDIITVITEGRKYEIEHTKDAFYPTL